MPRYCLNSTVTDTDRYIDMSFEAKDLYVGLNSAADGDGFIDAVKRVIRTRGVTPAALEELKQNGYVYQWGDGVAVIMDWYIMNNQDRSKYTKTKYQNHLAELGGGKIPGDGKTGERYYLKSECPEYEEPDREPNEEPQYNLTESNSISNTSRNVVIDIPVSNIWGDDRRAAFEYLFSDYPNRERLQEAERVFSKQIDEGATVEQIEIALNYYSRSSPERISSIESFLYAWNWYYKEAQKERV